MVSNSSTEQEINEELDENSMEVIQEENSDESIKINTHESQNNILPKKKKKKGIIYVSNIPKHMNVTRIREFLGQYGNIGRVYLQPEKHPNAGNGKKPKSKKKRLARHFTEGWIEYTSKRVAKEVAAKLNNTQIGTRKRSQFYDVFWSIKYLPKFQWVHLSEKLNYEQAVHKQKLMNEVSQARKEASFFQNNLDKSEMLKKKNRKLKSDS